MGIRSGTQPEIGPHAFLLRIHVESREVADAALRIRVWVRHLASGEARNVADIDELLNFLAALSGCGTNLLEWGRR